MRIGIVGYSGRKFNEDLAKKLIEIGCLSCIQEHGNDEEVIMVSGLTDLGIPALAYRFALEKGWKTVGIACAKAEEYNCFDVDYKIIVGEEWGDESDTFLDNIDCLVRVGGGEQSKSETNSAKQNQIPVYEYDLPEIKE